MSVITDTTTRRALRRSRRWRLPKLALAVALIAMLGTAVLLYPTVAAWFMQWEQSQLISDYSSEVGGIPTDERGEAIAAAERYNAALTDSVAELGANERIPTSDAEGSVAGYAEQLAANDQGLMARIQIPRIDADLPIYHGTTDDVLDIGVGHLEGTALPVGGVGTHSVLTAHRGLATAELFSRLNEVQVGDTFTVSVFGEVLTYRVRETKVVVPEDTETLYPQTGEDLVTLVTCTPLGVNSHRILVTAERIIPTPLSDIEAAEKAPVIPRFPWWAVIAGGVLFVLVVYVWLAGRPASAKKARRSTRLRSKQGKTLTDAAPARSDGLESSERKDTTMGVDDIVNKGKQMFEQNRDKIEEALKSEKAEEVSDKILQGAADAVKKVVPADQHAKVDEVRDNVDKHIGNS